MDERNIREEVIFVFHEYGQNFAISAIAFYRENPTVSPKELREFTEQWISDNLETERYKSTDITWEKDNNG